jgi:hypothetical protein
MEEPPIDLGVDEYAEEAAAEDIDLSTVYVSFSAEIDVGTTESLISTMANLGNNGVERVHLLMSTPGDAVMHAYHEC